MYMYVRICTHNHVHVLRTLILKYNVKVPRIHEEFSDDNNIYSTVMIIPVGFSTVFIAVLSVIWYIT